MKRSDEKINLGYTNLAFKTCKIIQLQNEFNGGDGF